MDGIEVLVVPVTDFDPSCLKHGEERRYIIQVGDTGRCRTEEIRPTEMLFA